MPRPSAPEVKPAPRRGPSGALIGVVVILVVALVVGLVWAVTRSSGDLSSEGSGNTLPEGGGVSIGPGVDADVMQVRVYSDYQCPWCGVLDRSVGEELGQLAIDREANVTYTLMSFLDGRIGNDASSRAANAALCADDAGQFLPFQLEVYQNQSEDGAGWTDEELVAFGETAGIGGEALDTFRSCVADQPHADYVQDMQERANRDGVTGTPRVFVNGIELGNEDMQRLMEDPSSLSEVLAANS